MAALRSASSTSEFPYSLRICSVIKNKCSLNEIKMDSAAVVLFGKTRQAVLTHLFDQPERTTYLRELSRQTGIGPGPLQNELNQLQKADLVVRQQDGNRVRYSANVAHPIFAELQSIVRKTCGLPAQIKAALASLGERISFACIYGSIAKGSDHTRSDVDLLFIGDLAFEQAIAAIAPVEEKLGREISVRLYSREEFRQRREAGDNSIRSVLDGERIDLLGKLDDA